MPIKQTMSANIPINTFSSLTICLAIIIATTESPVCGFTIRGQGSDTDLDAEGSSVVTNKYEASPSNIASLTRYNESITATDDKIPEPEISRNNVSSHGMTTAALEIIPKNTNMQSTKNSNNETITTAVKGMMKRNPPETRSETINTLSNTINHNESITSSTEKLEVTKPKKLASDVTSLLNETNNNESITAATGKILEFDIKPASDTDNLNDTSINSNLGKEIITENYNSLGNVNMTVLDLLISSKSANKNNSITDDTEIIHQPPANEYEKKENQTIFRQSEGEFSQVITNIAHVDSLNGSFAFAQTETTPIISEFTITTPNLTTYMEEFQTTESVNKYEDQSFLNEYVKGDQDISLTTVTDYPSIASNTDTVVETTLDLSSGHSSHSLFHQELNQTLKPDEAFIKQSNLSSSTDSPVVNIIAPMSATSTKLDMVVSRRGGYLINTKAAPLTSTETIITTGQLDSSSASLFQNENVSESSAIKGTDKDNITEVRTNNRFMEEDAIKEELLEERIMNDNQEYIKRYHMTTIPPSVTAPIPTDEVKQTTDKKAMLYTVSPNYKPLKKIEIQPTKQTVRDPDDNSWRNEGISSLGIVFKPKKPSKSFTEVLKNKTETELSNGIDKDYKEETLDLRERLEKMAEERKSKKKKINKFGNVVYGDYEENSSENTNSANMLTSTTPTTPFLSIFSDDGAKMYLKDDESMYHNEPLTTKKPTNVLNAEYYDTSDEYDAEYAKLVKVDIKKFNHPVKPNVITPVRTTSTTLTSLPNFGGRQATVQYFPPTKKTTAKLKMNDYDTQFRDKLNLYTFNESPKQILTTPYMTSSTPNQIKNHRVSEPVATSPRPPSFNFENNKYQFYPNEHIADPLDQFELNDKEFNRGSYVIKHYRDFINAAVKDVHEDSAMDVTPPDTEHGVTINELAKFTEKDGKMHEDDFDYDTHFRKDIISRFVDNFNQNSDRFKVDFPILYNNSVVHKQLDERGKVLASSTAFLRRQYENDRPKLSYINSPRSCGPNCDNNTSLVELSADYELHYYVPEQEEKEEIESKNIADFFDNRPAQLRE